MTRLNVTHTYDQPRATEPVRHAAGCVRIPGVCADWVMMYGCPEQHEILHSHSGRSHCYVDQFHTEQQLERWRERAQLITSA